MEQNFCKTFSSSRGRFCTFILLSACAVCLLGFIKPAVAAAPGFASTEQVWEQKSDFSKRTVVAQAQQETLPAPAFSPFSQQENLHNVDHVFSPTSETTAALPVLESEIEYEHQFKPISANKHISCENSFEQSPHQLQSPDRVFHNHCCHHQFTFSEDAANFFPMVWEDAKSVVNWENATYLGIALGGAIALRQDVDDDVRDYTLEHPTRWGKGSQFLGNLAEPQVQLPIMFGIYSWSLYHQDQELHDFSKSLFSAYAVSSLTTLTIKGIANTDRPSDDWNDGQYGFPSYHTSSSFAMAAVVEEYYGWEAGIPAYALAGLIGWSRIDERDHDLSDVVFGAALGCVIGKAIASRHLNKHKHVKYYPYVNPHNGGTGIMMNYTF